MFWVLMRIELPNLAAVPCRQRPKRAPERERERERETAAVAAADPAVRPH